MAQRIDTGFDVPAHTALQAMFGRAQITANRDGLRIGVVCDLAREEFLMVKLGNRGTDEVECLRVFEPVHDPGLSRDATIDTAPIVLEGTEEIVRR